jgi:hypothetical protein
MRTEGIPQPVCGFPPMRCRAALLKLEAMSLTHDPTRVHAGGPRPTVRQLTRELRDVAVAVPLAVSAPFVRRWHTRWGATDEEVAAEMPGDHLIPGCPVSWTRAITIDAPPAAVWPWLVQAGFGKAGFYSNDLLDNAGHPSAVEILPEHQRLRLGDWVPMFSRVDDVTAFKVIELEPDHHLLWGKPDSTWAWTLTPLPGGGTRLVTRLRCRYDWSAPAGVALSAVLLEFGDFPMMRRMLKGIKERAEGAAPRRRARRETG